MMKALANRRLRPSGAASGLAVLVAALMAATPATAAPASGQIQPPTVLRPSAPAITVYRDLGSVQTQTGRHLGVHVLPGTSKAPAATASCGESNCAWAVSGYLTYGGGTLPVAGYGVIQGRPRVYLLFVGSAWGTETVSGGYLQFSNDPSGAAALYQKEFEGLGQAAESWSSGPTEYCDRVSSGSSNCTQSSLLFTPRHIAYPPSTGALQQVAYINNPAYNNASADNMNQIVEAFVQQNSLDSSNELQNAQFLLAFAHGTHPGNFPYGNYCAYHTAVQDSTGNYISYSNLPYATDSASCSDGVTRSITVNASHEYVETLTDPVPGLGWTASAGTITYADGTTNTADYNEIGDLCANHNYAQVGLSTGTLPMATYWSNARQACVAD